MSAVFLGGIGRNAPGTRAGTDVATATATVTATSSGTPTDARGRALRDLRISLTDRCSLRCGYCMPREVFGPDYAFLERDELLTFDEIERLARAAVSLGVEKLRLTGGEPLLRAGVEELVARLAAIRTPAGAPVDLALTTNGIALPAKAQALRDAGLSRITVSLDTLREERFSRIADTRVPLQRVLDGIDAAARAGLTPIKVNAVIRRGINDDEVLSLAEHFRDTGHTLRFIEYMDVGTSHGWSLDEVVPSREIIARIDAVHPLEAIDREQPGATAARWRYRDGRGEIGVISSVTNAFCGSCTRARVSSEGRLFTCLFASSGVDLRAVLRGSEGIAAVRDALATAWGVRDDRYSERRAELTPAPGAFGASGTPQPPRIEMSYIGG